MGKSDFLSLVTKLPSAASARSADVEIFLILHNDLNCNQTKDADEFSAEEKSYSGFRYLGFQSI